MKSKTYIGIFLILLAAAIKARPVYAAPNSIPPATSIAKQQLDQAKVHDLYNAGDFDPVIAVLEGFIQTHKAYGLSDSIFIAKHLAVVYSANPATREKGKYYMFKLLELLPSAKLIDMFVSDEVDRIFDKVREEFVARQHAFGVDTTKLALPNRPNKNYASRKGRSSDEKVESSRESSWLVWTAIIGGTALLGAGGVYYWYEGQNQTTTPAQEPLTVKVLTPKI